MTTKIMDIKRLLRGSLLLGFSDFRHNFYVITVIYNRE